MSKKKSPSPSKEVLRREYSDLVSKATLADIRLVESFTKQEVKEGPLPDCTELQTEIEVALKSDHDMIRIRPKLAFIIRYKDDKPDDDPAIVVVARFQIMYQLLDSNITEREEIHTQFGQQVSLFNVWPYWREFVHSSFCRMGLPPLMVPLLKMGELIDLNSNSEAKKGGKRTKKKKR